MMSAEELGILDDGNRHELVDGRLRTTPPAGGEHGRIAHRLGMLLGVFVDEHQLGAVYAAETGFLIQRDPDTVRAPDVAFIASARIAQIVDRDAYVPFAPDLAGEVISPNDTFCEVEEKAFAWLNAGTRAVLLVDPKAATVHAYRGSDSIVVLKQSQTLQFGPSDAVPGWELSLARLFA